VKSQVAALFVLTLLSLTTGCGNIYDPNGNYAPASSWNIQSNDTSTGVDSWGRDNNYSCPNSATVAPVQITQTDQSNFFTVCKSVLATESWSILVHGKTTSSSTICFFPAVKTLNGSYNWIPDPSNPSTPTSTCSLGTTSGAYFVFTTLQKSNISFDSAFIVEQPFVNAMKYCLLSGLVNCPAYSVGKFR
jgi:hypothetical protein